LQDMLRLLPPTIHIRHIEQFHLAVHRIDSLQLRHARDPQLSQEPPHSDRNHPLAAVPQLFDRFRVKVVVVTDRVSWEPTPVTGVGTEGMI
jgi:hypothetical protein